MGSIEVVWRSCVGGGMVAVAEAEALWASGCAEVARRREGSEFRQHGIGAELRMVEAMAWFRGGEVRMLER